MRSKTEHPCPHRAVVEICGVPFCEPCAREQEAYFAVGELTREAQGPAASRSSGRWAGRGGSARAALARRRSRKPSQNGSAY